MGAVGGGGGGDIDSVRSMVSPSIKGRTAATGTCREVECGGS